MDNSAKLCETLKRIENVCMMLKALLSKDSAFNSSEEYVEQLAYLSYLVSEMDKCRKVGIQNADSTS